MPRDLYDEFEYDVALSFAGEDKRTAEELTNLLTERDLKVFHDELQGSDSPGVDMVLHLAELLRTKARYCVLIISQHYPLERWTEEERTAAQEHALRDPEEYFLLIRLDDREAPRIADSSGYRDLRAHSLESIAHLLEQKLRQTKGRSNGPPPESHDLRSGNVASNRRKPGAREEHER